MQQDAIAVSTNTAIRDGAIASWVIGGFLLIVGLSLIKKSKWQAPVGCTVAGFVTIVLGLVLWFGLSHSEPPVPPFIPPSQSPSQSPSMAPGISYPMLAAVPLPQQTLSLPASVPASASVPAVPVIEVPVTVPVPVSGPHQPQQPQTLPPRPILRKPSAFQLDTVPTSFLSPTSPAPKRVKWVDDNKPVGSPLEYVKTFDNAEAPVAIRQQDIVQLAQHPPKQVPAMTLRRKMASAPGPHLSHSPHFSHPPHSPHPSPHLPYSEFGYETPYAHAPVLTTIQTPDPVGPSPGPVFYTPPSKYKTPDDIAKEREVLWNTPETAETVGRRRQAMLREVAMTLKPDRMAVPIGVMV